MAEQSVAVKDNDAIAVAVAGAVVAGAAAPVAQVLQPVTQALSAFVLPAASVTIPYPSNAAEQSVAVKANVAIAVAVAGAVVAGAAAPVAHVLQPVTHYFIIFVLPAASVTCPYPSKAAEQVAYVASVHVLHPVTHAVQEAGAVVVAVLKKNPFVGQSADTSAVGC
jgi:hypothetical protein